MKTVLGGREEKKRGKAEPLCDNVPDVVNVSKIECEKQREERHSLAEPIPSDACSGKKAFAFSNPVKFLPLLLANGHGPTQRGVAADHARGVPVFVCRGVFTKFDFGV